MNRSAAIHFQLTRRLHDLTRSDHDDPETASEIEAIEQQLYEIEAAWDYASEYDCMREAAQ
jgi:hypothetical protein